MINLIPYHVYSVFSRVVIHMYVSFTFKILRFSSNVLSK